MLMPARINLGFDSVGGKNRPTRHVLLEKDCSVRDV